MKGYAKDTNWTNRTTLLCGVKLLYTHLYKDSLYFWLIRFIDLPLKITGFKRDFFLFHLTAFIFFKTRLGNQLKSTNWHTLFFILTPQTLRYTQHLYL